MTSPESNPQRFKKLTESSSHTPADIARERANTPKALRRQAKINRQNAQLDAWFQQAAVREAEAYQGADKDTLYPTSFDATEMATRALVNREIADKEVAADRLFATEQAILGGEPEVRRAYLLAQQIAEGKEINPGTGEPNKHESITRAQEERLTGLLEDAEKSGFLEKGARKFNLKNQLRRSEEEKLIPLDSRLTVLGDLSSIKLETPLSEEDLIKLITDTANAAPASELQSAPKSKLVLETEPWWIPAPLVIESQPLVAKLPLENDDQTTELTGPGVGDAEALSSKEIIEQQPHYAALMLDRAGKKVRGEATGENGGGSQDYIAVGSSGNFGTKNDIFVLFDGMGGEEGDPAAAAKAGATGAVEYIRREVSSEHSMKNTFNKVGDLINSLRSAFNSARVSVTERGEGGKTVGTMTCFVDLEGKLTLAYAHVGDTRLYRYNKKTKFYDQITKDQGEGSDVTNCMPGTYDVKDVYGYTSVNEGDVFMLCSDGVTGDLPWQELSASEFREAFAGDSPDAIARKFIKLSKKTDDTSVVVIDADELYGK